VPLLLPTGRARRHSHTHKQTQKRAIKGVCMHAAAALATQRGRGCVQGPSTLPCNLRRASAAAAAAQPNAQPAAAAFVHTSSPMHHESSDDPTVCLPKPYYLYLRCCTHLRCCSALQGYKRHQLPCTNASADATMRPAGFAQRLTHHKTAGAGARA
jgi:hypothetical protein